MGRHTTAKNQYVLIHNGVAGRPGTGPDFINVPRNQDRAAEYDRPEGMPWTGQRRVRLSQRFNLNGYMGPTQSAAAARKTREMIAAELKVRRVAKHEKRVARKIRQAKRG